MIPRGSAIILEGFEGEIGSPGRIRTADQRINSPLVYPCIYRGISIHSSCRLLKTGRKIS